MGERVTHPVRAAALPRGVKDLGGGGAQILGRRYAARSLRHPEERASSPGRGCQRGASIMTPPDWCPE